MPKFGSTPFLIFFFNVFFYDIISKREKSLTRIEKEAMITMADKIKDRCY